MINSLSFISEATIKFLKPSQSSPFPVNLDDPSAIVNLAFLNSPAIALSAEAALSLAKLSFLEISPSGEA